MAKRKPRVKLTLDNIEAVFQQSTKRMSVTLTNYVKRWYGRRCPDFDGDCIVCQMWTAVDQVNEALDRANDAVQEATQ